MDEYEVFNKALIYAQRISCPNENPKLVHILQCDKEYLLSKLQPVVDVYNILKQTSKTKG